MDEVDNTQLSEELEVQLSVVGELTKLLVVSAVGFLAKIAAEKAFMKVVEYKLNQAASD